MKGKKGVSPLVASVLLIAFTMTLAAVLTAWITSFTTTQKEKGRQAEQQLDCAYMSIDAQADYARVNFSYAPSTAVFEAYVVNNGLGDIKITKVEITSESGEHSRIYKLTDPVTIRKDDTAYVDINITKLIEDVNIADENDLLSVKLMTPCDSVFAIISRPFGGWGKLKSPLNQISNVE